MRTITIAATLLLLALPGITRAASTPDPDSLAPKVKRVRLHERPQKGETLLPRIAGDPITQRVYKRSETTRFRGHWSGYYYGFLNASADDGEVPGSANFLDYSGGASFTMLFNPFQYQFRFSRQNNFGLVTGFGLEYQRFRFKHDNTIAKDGDRGILPSYLADGTVKKSSLKNLFLTIPALLEWQFPARAKHKAFLSAGVVAGIRLHTKTKMVYNDEEGEKRKEKQSGSFHSNPVKADIQLRAGYRVLTLWGSYTLTRQFEDGKAPHVHPYAIGLGINF